MTFLEPLRAVVAEIVQQTVQKQTAGKAPQERQCPLRDPLRFVDDLVRDANQYYFGMTWRVPSNFSPPTIKICRNAPDLLIDSTMDPTGILRGGLELAFRIALPAVPLPQICFEVPLQQLEDLARGLLETLIPSLTLIPLAREILKGAGIIQEVELRRLSPNPTLVKELRENLKTMGVLREVHHLRRLPSTHPSVKELREKLKQVKH